MKIPKQFKSVSISPSSSMNSETRGLALILGNTALSVINKKGNELNDDWYFVDIAARDTINKVLLAFNVLCQFPPCNMIKFGIFLVKAGLTLLRWFRQLLKRTKTTHSIDHYNEYNCPIWKVVKKEVKYNKS